MDAYNYRHENNTRARAAVKDLMTKHNVVYLYKERNPETKRYAWREGRPVMKQARLDVSPPLRL